MLTREHFSVLDKDVTTLHEKELDSGIVGPLAWHPTAQRLAISHTTHSGLFDLDTQAWTPFPELEKLGHNGDEAYGGWNPSGERLLLAALDFGVNLWDGDGSNHRSLRMNGVGGGTWHPDGDRFIVADGVFAQDAKSVVYDLEGEPIQEFPGCARGGWSPDGEWLVMATPNGTNLLEVATGRTVPLRYSRTTSEAYWEPGGTRVLLWTYDHAWTVWNREGQLLLSVPATSEHQVAGCWEPDGDRITTFGLRGVRSWPIAEEDLLQEATRLAPQPFSAVDRASYLE